jgi:hypothetical protein
MRLLGAWIVVALVLAGCTTEPASIESTSATASYPSVVEYPLVYPGPPATIAIGATGTIGIDAEALCVTLTDEGGQRRVLAFSEDLAPTVDLSDPSNPSLVAEGCVLLRNGDDALFYGTGTWDRDALAEYLVAGDVQRCGTTVTDILMVGYCSGPSSP